MLGKVIEAFIMLILVIEVLTVILSIMVIVKNLTLTVSQVGNIYSTKVCVSNKTPLEVTLMAGSSEALINPGQYGCLIINSTQLLSNVTLGLGLFNITLGVEYAR
ncbi:hypothetical protein [Caldivirga maquilingensis]|uniref:Uncharacterized protein n=1 Tax=Caldivirga maquilingensis (strain ATCC 700844 / DSM 13496 / JCM 10307 / IC-167) TaxID=397948 RepID=A8MB87_CALMQ|nr:hypothetical protein [Caldivirga maquilingensis]ABW01177.1 hypothetical protein Cmaq_0331 [Caldivirga maquilingensis IC-167]